MVFVFATSLAGISSAGISGVKEPCKILILPFTIHSENDLSFLNKGIMEMLSTRLARKDKVVVLRHTGQGIAEGKIPALAAKYKADYVIIGTLTVFGESVSTDAKIIDLEKNTPVMSFHRTGKERGHAIFHSEEFADKINEKLCSPRMTG